MSKKRFEEILSRAPEKAEVMTKSEKLRYAMSLGHRTEQVVCPVCSRNRVLYLTSRKSIEKGKEGRVSFSSADFDRIHLMVTYAIPRQGFHVNPSESMSFREMISSDEYSDIIGEIYEQCGKIRKVIEDEKD